MSVIVNGTVIDTTNAGKLLGLNISSIVLVGHIKEGDRNFAQLRRFRNVTPKINSILVKSLVIYSCSTPPFQLAWPQHPRKEKLKVS